jgi:glycosyltransferase involved in cell wall biosynthesis
MRVAVIGGIYGKSMEYRETVRITPETTLESGLRARGIDVTTFSHYARIDRQEFDIIHVHHLSWGAVRAAVDRSPAAFVFTAHDGAALTGTLSRRKKLAMAFVVERADALVALSSPEADFQKRDGSVKGALHRVIANGVDPAPFPRRRTNQQGVGAPWEVLFVGQLVEIKRVDLLLKALAAAGYPFNLKLAYQNPQLKLDLQALAERLGIARSVEFLGPRNPEELCALYNAADMLVLPSSGEALPTVVTEAMLTGTPVIATDVGGIRAQLGGFGILVPPDRPEELAGALREMYSNYARFFESGASMASYARRNFSAEAMVAQHIEMYEQLAATRMRRRRRTALWLSNTITRTLLSCHPQLS